MKGIPRLGTFMCLVVLTGCASGPSRTSPETTVESAVAPTEPASEPVSITTFGTVTERSYLEALQRDVRFEARDGCLYVGDDQTVWFSGTMIRRKPGSTEYEVFDDEGRKLAETGTTVYWGGGQVNASEAEKYDFVEKLSISSTCAARGDDYWLVGKIGEPKFESSN